MAGLPPESTYYFYRGRVALYALLRALDIQPGDEVLVPGFTCIAVPGPIIGMKAKPVYVDISAKTYNIDPVELEKKITSRSRVIVAQHTFGNPCDMDSIMHIARKYSLDVIEDTCHVWGGKYRGMELGSIGVAAFYSYDPGKPFIIGMGGAATVNSMQLRQKMGTFYGTFRKPAMSDTTKLHVQYFAYRLTNRPHLFWSVRGLYRLLSRKGLTVATWTSDTLAGKVGADYEKGLAPSLQRRLTAQIHNGDTVVSRHKKLANFYEGGLHALGISVLDRESHAEPVLICYPLQVTGKGALLEEARRARVELGDWFSSPVHPLSHRDWGAVGYQAGSCPVAERVAKQIITLPCHAGVTKREAERTLGFLRLTREQGLLGDAAADGGGNPVTTSG
jgi:perosamine synthetase